jgi:hypothetical protein
MDLHLIQSFLDLAQKGFSINNLVFRKPTHLYRSDASKFGLGGYNIISGRAWRFELPIELWLRMSLNALEFLACVITIWIDILYQEIPPESCILSQTDRLLCRLIAVYTVSGLLVMKTSLLIVCLVIFTCPMKISLN